MDIADDTRLIDAMRYSLLAGGKRLRPVLFYASCDSLGGADYAAEDIDRVACAIECLHTYSLIHDDLPAMDDDDLRRGMPSCHRAFDEATAILAGDALQALSFELISAAATIPAVIRVELVATLAQASGCNGMVAGQALDLALVGAAGDRAILERMHRLKTGRLIRATLRMGALVAGATEDALARIDRFGEALGLAFQVQDDILDETGQIEVLGKPPGSDASQNKPTYASLLGVAAARDLARQLLEEAMTVLEPCGAEFDALRDLARYSVTRNS